MNDPFTVIVALCCIQLALMAAIGFQQWFYTKAIKDLIDRLMARDITQYQQAKNPPPPRVIMKTEPPVEDFGRIMG